MQAALKKKKKKQKKKKEKKKEEEEEEEKARRRTHWPMQLRMRFAMIWNIGLIGSSQWRVRFGMLL